MSEYLACGNIVIDEVISENGQKSEYAIGGPAFFGLMGIRLFTKSVRLVSRVGRDFYDKDGHGDWLIKNGVSDESVLVRSEHCNRFTLTYESDGYREISKSVYGDANLGYLRTKPEDIAIAAENETKGIYLTSGVDKIIWQKLYDIKEKFGLKIGYELEHWNCGNDIGKIRDILPLSDLFSVNKHEASLLFNIEANDDKRMLEKLTALPSKCILYRVGSRGSYIIKEGKILFSPSINILPFVNETGCGNTAVAAATYSLCEGENMQTIVARANIAASICAAAEGPYPFISDEIMDFAEISVKQHIEKCVEIK